MTKLFMGTHKLIHNSREIKKILMTDEQDGALAVVDIETSFEQTPDEHSPWDEGGGIVEVKGRAAKIYTWSKERKLLYQPGTMHYQWSA